MRTPQISKNLMPFFIALDYFLLISIAIISFYAYHENIVNPKPNSPLNNSQNNSSTVGSNNEITAEDNRNAQRSSDITTILNAVYQYSINNQGNLPTGIPTTPQPPGFICATGATNCNGLVNLSVLTNESEYLVSMPRDPNSGSSNNTGYTILQDNSGRVTVSAPRAENNQTISVTR